MIARVNCAKASGLPVRERANSGTAIKIFSTRSGRPITPVEHTRTCEGLSFDSSCATFLDVASEAEYPSAPVQQFALPELTITACIFPRERRKWICDRRTGAAWTRLVVNIAAAAAGVSLTSSPRSSPDFFNPQAAEENENPRGICDAVTEGIMLPKWKSPNHRESTARCAQESRWRPLRSTGKSAASDMRGNFVQFSPSERAATSAQNPGAGRNPVHALQRKRG